MTVARFFKNEAKLSFGHYVGLMSVMMSKCPEKLYTMEGGGKMRI